MKEHILLRDIIRNIYASPNGIPKDNIDCDTYNLTEPYSYIEAICVSIIKIQNGEEDYIEDMKRKEDLFQTSEDRIAFIQSGTHVSRSAYHRFAYSHTNESISNFVSQTINNSPTSN
jgi:hypothetical protein